MDWSEKVGELAKELAFERWPSPLFEADFWQSSMHGVRVFLPLALAALLLLEFAVRRGRGRVPVSVSRRVGIAFVALGFLTYYEGFNPNSRNPGLYSPSAFYQQYLGAKYRPELSNAWLFDCAIAAEKALGGRNTIHSRYIRSQIDPEQLVPAGTTLGALQPELCSERFGVSRWEEFKSDIEWFRQAVEPAEWSNLHQQRWFVASPGWLKVVGPLVDAKVNEHRLRWLSLLAPLLHLLTLLAMAWGFGLRVAAIGAVVWAAQPFFPFTDGVGLLQNAWVMLLLGGLCALKKRHLYAGGILLAGASALNPYVLLVFAGAAATALGPLLWRRPIRSLHLKALSAWLLALGLLFTASAGPHRSFGRYVSELSLQRSLPELQDVGLAPSLANVEGERYRFLRNDALANPAEDWSLSRARTVAQLRGELIVLLAAFGLWLFGLTLCTRDLWLGAALGAAALTAPTQPLSSAIGLLILVPLCAKRIELAPVLLLAAAITEVLWTRTHFPDDRAAVISALLLLTAVVATLAFSPPVRRYLLARTPSANTATKSAGAR